MIDHGQNAPGAGVNRYGCAIHVAERVDRRLAYHWIFSRSHITLGDVRVGERAGRKMLVITMTHQNRAADDAARFSVYHHDPGFSNRAGMTQPSHVPASMGTFLNSGNVGMTGGPGGTSVGRFR